MQCESQRIESIGNGNDSVYVLYSRIPFFFLFPSLQTKCIPGIATDSTVTWNLLSQLCTKVKWALFLFPSHYVWLRGNDDDHNFKWTYSLISLWNRQKIRQCRILLGLVWRRYPIPGFFPSSHEGLHSLMSRKEKNSFLPFNFTDFSIFQVWSIHPFTFQTQLYILYIKI